MSSVLRLALTACLAAAAVAVPCASGASGADVFRTPSGNIVCAYEHYSGSPRDLRCEIRTGLKPLPPKPSSCTADWGAGYRLLQTGQASVLCISDTVATSTAAVLRYGTTKQYGVFRCTSTVQGLRCLNASGHGFFLSKERSYRFKAPAPQNGAFKTPSRNIVCGYSIAPDHTASMECGIKSGLKPPPKPIACDAGDPNDKRVSLRDRGRAVPVLCAGDPGPLLPQIELKADVLDYGDAVSFGGITCESQTAGLTCRNRDGHGFFLSRQRWRTF